MVILDWEALKKLYPSVQEITMDGVKYEAIIKKALDSNLYRDYYGNLVALDSIYSVHLPPEASKTADELVGKVFTFEDRAYTINEASAATDFTALNITLWYVVKALRRG